MKMSRFGLRSSSEGFKLLEEHTMRASHTKKGGNNINNNTSATSHISHCPRITAAIDTGSKKSSLNTSTEIDGIETTKLQTSHQKHITPKKLKKKKNFLKLESISAAENEILQQQKSGVCNKEGYNVEQHKSCKSFTTINTTTSVTHANQLTKTVSIVCSLPLERLPRIVEKLSILKKQNQKQQQNSSEHTEQKQQEQREHQELALLDDRETEVDHALQEKQLKRQKPAATINILCLYCDKKFATNKLQMKHVEKTHMKRKEPRRRCSGRNVQQQQPEKAAQCHQFIGCIYCNSENGEGGKIKLKQHIAKPMSSSSSTTSFSTATQICVPAKDLTPLFIHLTEYHADKYFGCKSCILRFQSSAKLAKHMHHMHHIEQQQQHKITFPLMTTRKRERELKGNNDLFNEHDNDILFNDGDDSDNDKKEDIGELVYEEQEVAMARNLKKLKRRKKLKKKSSFESTKTKSSLDRKKKVNIVISDSHNSNSKLRRQNLLTSTASEIIKEEITKEQKKSTSADTVIVFSSSSRLLVGNDVDDDEQMLSRLGLTHNQLPNNRNRGTHLRREVLNNCLISGNKGLSKPNMTISTSITRNELKVQQQQKEQPGLQKSNTSACNIVSSSSKQQHLSNNNRNSRKFNQIHKPQHVVEDIITSTSATLTLFRVPSTTDLINNASTLTTISSSLLASSSSTSSLSAIQAPSVAASSLSCVFDDNFYKEVVINVRNNLLHHLDGKISMTTNESRFLTGTTPVLTSSLLQTKFKYQPTHYRHNQKPLPPQLVADSCTRIAHYAHTELHEATSLPSATVFPTLLTAEQYGPAIVDTIVPSPLAKTRRPHTKHSWKWDYVTKFKFFNEGGKTVKKIQQPQCGLRDLANLDMWTQLTMRQKYELNRHLLYQLNPQSPPVFEKCQPYEESMSLATDLLAEERARLEKQQLVEQLNYILDLRLLPHIILEQNEQAVIKFETDEFGELAAQKRDEYDSGMSDLMTQTFADNSFLSIFQLQPRINNSVGSQLATSAPQNNLVLSGEWARPRCYLCICCGAKFEKLKSLEEHKMFRHSHIYATHYEVVGRELLAGNLLKHLFIPKCALSRYDAMNNRSCTAYRWQQLQHHRFRQHHHHRHYHYHRQHHHTKHERSTAVEDESSDSVQSICALQTTYGNISCGDDISMSDKHLATSLLSTSSSYRQSLGTPLNTTAIPMDDCYTTTTTDTKTTLDLNNVSPTHSSSSCNASQSSSTSSSSCTARSRVKGVTIKNDPQTERRSNSNSNSSSATISTSFTIATNSISNVLKDHTATSAAFLNAMPTPCTTSCTKCGRKSNGVLDLYRHMLDCSGDYLWSMAKKRKYRYYCGSKKRRPCNKHIAVKRIIKRSSKAEVARPLCDAQMTPNYTEESGSSCSKTKTPPRQRPSDAESIRKMLENLPAKRVCKKIFPTDNKKNKKSKVLKNKLVVVSRTRNKIYSQHVLRKTRQRQNSPTRRLSCVKNMTLCQQQQMEQQREQQQKRKQGKQMIKVGCIAVNKKVTSINQPNGSGASTSAKAARSFISTQRENSSAAVTAISINKSSNSDIIITRSSSASKDLNDLEIITSDTSTILNRKTSKSRSRSPKTQHSVIERVLHNSTNSVDGCRITVGTARMQRRCATVTNPKNNMDNIPSSNLDINEVGRANISSVKDTTLLTNKSLLPTPPTTPATITNAIPQGNLNSLVQSSNFNSTTSTKLNTNASSNVKRSKRISDCIAMLTGKLEEKLKTEQPIVTKGSSIKISNSIINTVNQNPSQSTESKMKEANEDYQCGNTNKTKEEKSTYISDSLKTAKSLYSNETKDQKEQCQTPMPSIIVCTPPSSSSYKILKRKTVSRRIIKSDEVLLLPEESQIMSVTVSNGTFSRPPPPILEVGPAETIVSKAQQQVDHLQVKSRRQPPTTKSASKPIIASTPPLSPAVIQTTIGISGKGDQQLLQEPLLTIIPKTTGSSATVNATFGINNNDCHAGESITTLKNTSISKLSTANKKLTSQSMASPISQVTTTAAVQMNVLQNLPLFLPMDNHVHAATATAAQLSMSSMPAPSIPTQPMVYKEVGGGTVTAINAIVTKNIESKITSMVSNLPLPVQLQQLAMAPPTTSLFPATAVSQSQQQVLNSPFASTSTNLIGTQHMTYMPSAVPLQPPLPSNTLPGSHGSITESMPTTNGLQHTKQLVALPPPHPISGNGVASGTHHLSQFGMEPLNLTSTKSSIKNLGLGQQKEINDSHRVGIPVRRQTICGFEARNLIMLNEMEPLDLSKKSTRNKHPSSTDIRVGYIALTSTAVTAAAAGGTTVGSVLNEGQHKNKNLGSTNNQLPPPQDMPLPLVRGESTLNNLHTELSLQPTQLTATASAAAPTSIALQQQLKNAMRLGVGFTPGSLAELPISAAELLLNKHFYSNLDLLKIPQVRNPVVATFVPSIATGPQPSPIAPTASLPQSSIIPSNKVNNHETSPAIQPLTQPSGTSSTFSISPIVACTKTTPKKRSGGSSSGNIKNMQFNNMKSDSTSFSVTSAYRKDSNSSKHQIRSCSKLMDEVINNHIDDAINSVIMAVQASLPDDDQDNNNCGKVNGVGITPKETETKALAMTPQPISAAGQVQQVEHASVRQNQSLRQATLVTTPVISTVEVLPVPLPSLRLRPSIDTSLPTPTSIIYSEAAVKETMPQQKAGKSLVPVPPILSLQKPQTEQQPIRHLTPKKRARAKTIDCRSALLTGETSPFGALEQTTAKQQMHTLSILPIIQQQEQQTHDGGMTSSVTAESPISIMPIPRTEVTYLKVKTTDCKYIEPLKKYTAAIEKTHISIEESNSKEVINMIRNNPLITTAMEVKTIKVGNTIENSNKDSLFMDTKWKLQPETCISQTKMKAPVATTMSRQVCKEPGNNINCYSLISEEHKDMNISSMNIEQQQTKDGKRTLIDLKPIGTTTTEVSNSEFIKSSGDHTNTLASNVAVVKKQRRRRKNELAAIVADQLLESFKIDNARRDNLKKLENLAYEKSEDLLLTGILLMSSTKRNAAEKQQQTPESPSKRSKIDNTVTNTITRKHHCTDNQIISPIGGDDKDNNIPPILELKATRGRPKRRQSTYQKRSGVGNRAKTTPMPSENISKLKSTLESFSIGIEKQLSEIEAKNSRINTSFSSNNKLIKSSPNAGKGRARKKNIKAETVSGSITTPLPTSSILRPSILNSAAQEVQTQIRFSKIDKESIDRVTEHNVKHKSVPKLRNDEMALKVGGAIDDQIKNTVSDVATVSQVPQSVCVPANNVTITVYSRDPRLNKNIHKEENIHVTTQSQQNGTKLQDRRLRLNEFCDLEEDNYLTEIAKNVNEKIMSGANEDFGFANDEFELNNEPDSDNDDDGEDEHDKYYRPPTSMSVRSAPNLNDDHSNFDSICDDNTNTEVMDMDLDDEISVYTSYSQDVGRGCRRRRRRRSILLTRRPKKRSILSHNLSTETFDCVLCKKTFFTGTSLAKHNMTLAHVSKVSEQEYLMSKTNGAGVNSSGEEKSPPRIMEDKIMTPLNKYLVPKQMSLPLSTPISAPLTDATEGRTVPPIGCKIANCCLSAASSINVPDTLSNSGLDVERRDFPPLSPELPEKVVFTTHSKNPLLITEETLRMHDHHQQNLQLCQQQYNNPQQKIYQQHNHQLQQQNQQHHQQEFSSDSHSNDLVPNSSRLNMNPDERLFFECANILKGVKTSHISQSTRCEDPRLNKVHAYAYTNAPPSVSRPPPILVKKSTPPTQAPPLPPPASAAVTPLAMNVEFESPQSPSPESTTARQLSPPRQHHHYPQVEQHTPPQQSPRSPSPTPNDLQQINQEHRRQLSIFRNPQAMNHHTDHLLTYDNKLPLPIMVAAASSPLPVSTQNMHADPTTNQTSLRLSPNYSAISQFSATNMTTSRFKTKAAMKGYENDSLTLHRETKSRAICKLTELADIALGSEKPNSREFLTIQPSQLSLSTPTSESDSNSKNEYRQDHHHHHDNQHHLTQQQRHYSTQNQLQQISDTAGGIVTLLHQNNRNAATNENPASTSSKAFMNSVAVVVANEQGRLQDSTTTASYDIAEQNKIVIPERPFKNIGLEEKETIQFQKPKITSLSLLTTEDDNNSVSTASYSDRDDYDFGTMSCCDENDDNENENSVKLDAIKKHEVKQNTDSSSTAPTSSGTSATSSSSSSTESSTEAGGSTSNTSSSRATRKTLENKSLIMGRIFKNASSKVKTNEIGNVIVVASSLSTVTHKVKNSTSAAGGGLQKEQCATSPLPPPQSKANLDQLFDELRGASERVKSNETISSGVLKTSMATTDNAKRQHMAIIQPAFVSAPKDPFSPVLSTKENQLIFTQQHPKAMATTCSVIQTPAARKVSVPTPRSKRRTTKAKKNITSSTTAKATKPTQIPEKLTEKGATGKTAKNIQTPRCRGRKDITKLQTELGMSQEEIEKLIDEGQRKSKRRCATNRTKKLVETWSSDEYEEFLSTKDIIALIEEKEQQEKRRKGKKTITNVSSKNASCEIQQVQSVVPQQSSTASGMGSISLSIQFGGKRHAKQKAQLKKVNAAKAATDRAKSRVETGVMSIPDTGDDKNNKTEPKKCVSVSGGDKPKQQRRNNIVSKVTRAPVNIGSTLMQSLPLTKAPRITSRSLTKVGGGKKKKNNVTNSNFVDGGTELLTPAAQSIWKATKVVTKQYDAAPSASSSTASNKRYIFHGNKACKTQTSASSTVRTTEKLQCQRNDHHEVVSRSKLSRRNNNANKNINTNTVVSSNTTCRAGADGNGTTELSINNNNSSRNNKNLKNKRNFQINHNNQSSATRRKRPATEKQLYYWSSSSSSSIAASSSSGDVDNGYRQQNEHLSYNEDHQYSATTDGVSREQPQQEKCYKQDQEHFDETTEQYQKHGWIVGDSHKKLVKLLAIAKGGNTKVDNRCSVKRQTLKRKCL